VPIDAALQVVELEKSMRRFLAHRVDIFEAPFCHALMGHRDELVFGHVYSTAAFGCVAELDSTSARSSQIWEQPPPTRVLSRERSPFANQFSIGAIPYKWNL